MITAKKTPFEQAVGYLAGLKPQFAGLPRYITDNVCEIRIRTGQTIALEMAGNSGTGGTGTGGTGGSRRVRLGEPVTAEQIHDCVKEFCGYSLHSFEKQFKEGWITLEGGHRAGFTGTAVLRGGEVENLRDLSSLNLRIARQYIGCAEELYAMMSGGDSRSKPDGRELTGLLVIGRPMSGKTTVLRDLCRLTSARRKVALIDERSEIAAVHNGVPALDVGENTDILNGFPKAGGIMTALRSLSPEYVICDEIGWEVAELTAVAHSGVKMIIAAHGGSLKDAYSSARIGGLLESGGISHIALLGHGKNIGKVEFYGTNKGLP